MVSLKFLTGQETHIISYIANKNRRHLGDDFLLEQCRYPINQAINYAGGNAVDNDWPGNCEHLGGGAKDKALCPEFHSRGGDGIGKAGNGHQGACPRYFGQVII